MGGCCINGFQKACLLSAKMARFTSIWAFPINYVFGLSDAMVEFSETFDANK